MNTAYRRVPAEFGPETRFEVKPVPAVPFRAAQENLFERLKVHLLQERLEELWQPGLNSPVRRAANEAAALAWTTPFPLLLFPGLFAEKADQAVTYAERQEQVRQHTREMLAV
ncbi:MAG TPA: hypothetical protein VNT26_10090 [Candidatus Sulfotelmatobacter sp.]|nr:hypothetical protein [Candidatus Sulfotelmatobacter sp.]